MREEAPAEVTLIILLALFIWALFLLAGVACL